MTERAALVTLLRDATCSWAAITDEIQIAGSALEVLEMRSAREQTLFDDPSLIERGLVAVEEEIRQWESQGMRLVTILDDGYPAQLLTVHQRPPFIMMRGESEGKDAHGVAIVGSRAASQRGLEQSHQLAFEIAKSGRSVISGLAAGIDSAAHLGALDAGGRTVAVIGTGLRRVYPPQNAQLQARIAEEGLVISQFFPDSSPSKASFPMRNAVMSGYAAATLVVEASWKSGAKMQARLALQHGRKVILMKSLLEHDWARDFASLPNTTVASDVASVIDALEGLADLKSDLVWA
jgi:DNA processing protein